MKALKKSIIIIAVIFAVAVLASVILYFFFKPVFYHFLYPFDRITGIVHVTMDGEKYNLISDDVIGQYEFKDEINVKVSNDADGLRTSIHGGEYGPYSLTIYIDGYNDPIEVGIYQYNWWNVTKFDLDISIDSEAATITFTSVAEVNGTKENHSTTVAISDEQYVFYIVSV